LYILHIGIGIDSLMIRDTERTAKRRFGRAAYIWTAFTRLIGYQPRRFTIIVDGQRTRPHAAQVLIANGGVLGVQPFRWGPHIRPDDGRIDVCIVSARTLFDYLWVGWHLLIGRQQRHPNIRYLSAERSIVVSADRPLPVQADGEIIGETPVRVQVVPAAVRVIVPAAKVGSPRRAEADLVSV
jgi:diacylglycerol kinase family enzyme